MEKVILNKEHECLFTGGREVTPEVKLVPSNYHARITGEKLVLISGPVSLGTLRDILETMEMFSEAAPSEEPSNNAFQIAHKHSFKNRAEVEASTSCGCFHCHAIFSPSEIEHWVDDSQTAFCPHCGIDSVIGNKSGYPMTPEFFQGMGGWAFQAAPEQK